jgi:hypothetical protein
MKNFIGESIKCEDNFELNKEHMHEFAKRRRAIVESDTLENDSEHLEEASG